MQQINLSTSIFSVSASVSAVPTVPTISAISAISAISTWDRQGVDIARMRFSLGYCGSPLSVKVISDLVEQFVDILG